MNKRKSTSENANKTKLIIKGNPAGHFRNDTKISFKVTKSSPYFNKVPHLCLFPTFNCDDKYYTPAFILPFIDQISDEQYLAVHRHKVEESLKQNSEEDILVPKPRSKHKYCGVCRKYYDQYLQHIDSKQHLESLGNSKYQKAIVDQCQKFRTEFLEEEVNPMQKIKSIQTKINEDQNSTESFIEQKKEFTIKLTDQNKFDEPIKLTDFNQFQEPIVESLVV